jgi:phosphoglycolate phosphatase-like HAD superfamily hydrolase
MKQPISAYNTLVFDCDGVVLDSNKVKTDAFYQAALPYGEAAARAMVEYHVANGGVSRFKKFAHFLAQIVTGQAGPDLDALLEAYADQVHEGLLSCTIAPSLAALRQSTPNTRWLIASGGDQTELRDVFAQRGIANLFDGGIFGSPDDKDEIIKREIFTQNIQQPALLIGDSKYDYEVSVSEGIDFIFLAEWSEIRDWSHWAQQNKIVCKRTLRDLLDV